jgi:hypothetical protein
MKTTFASLIVAISATVAANATCSYGGSGLVWNFRVYTGHSCTGAHHLEYFGSRDICECFNINSPLNDNVNSFVYTSGKTISLYKDAGCKSFFGWCRLIRWGEYSVRVLTSFGAESWSGNKAECKRQ